MLCWGECVCDIFLKSYFRWRMKPLINPPSRCAFLALWSRPIFFPSVLIIGSWRCHRRAENMAEDIKSKLDNYRTAPFDARFPNQNQTRNCWSNYLGKAASQGQTSFRTFLSVQNERKTSSHVQSRARWFAVPWTIERLLYCWLLELLLPSPDPV